MAEVFAKVMAHEFEEFQITKDLEIQGMQEEVQDHGVALTNRDNIINNLQVKIHEL
jgi:hypothetical protein